MGKTLKRQRQRAKALQAQQPKRLKLEKGSRMAAAVSVALEQGRWADAIKGLEGMAQAGKQPKLGAIMRWVRQADQAGDEQVAAPLLDAIMRAAAAAGPTGAPSADGAAAAAAPATAAARPAATATNGTHAAAVAAAAQAKASRGVERHAPLEVCPLGHIHGQPEYREQPPAQPAASAAAAATAAAGQASTACRAAEGDEEPSTSTQQAAGGAAAAMPVGTSNASGDGEGAAAPALRTSAHPASSCPHPPLSGALQPEHYVSLFYELPFAGEGMRGGPNAIYAFTPGTIHYEATHPSPTRLEVPFVPGAFVLRGAFSRSECAQILAASQALGYRHDVDYTFAAGSSTAGGGGGEGGGQEGRSAAGAAASSSGDGGGGAAPAAVGAPSVAAGSHSDSSGAAAAGAPSAARGVAASLAGAAAGGPAAGCVWYADDSLLGPLYERVRSLLPQELGGGALAGINARWRLYRYSPGAVYRPHVDGAWPGSGLAPDGSYIFDAYGDRWSRLTFLVYLNEGFEGGATTFYMPSGTPGVLDARGVAPRTGCVLVFPHGDTMGSLVHEGSAVVSGAKYVIRTEVLYKLPPPKERGGGMQQQQHQQPAAQQRP